MVPLLWIAIPIMLTLRAMTKQSEMNNKQPAAVRHASALKLQQSARAKLVKDD